MSEDFLDALEARLPGEVDRRARTVDPRRVSRAIDRALAPAPTSRKSARTRLWVGLAAAAVLVAASAAAAIGHHRVSPPAPAGHALPQPAIVQNVVEPTIAFEPALSVDDLPRAAPPPMIATSDVETASDLFSRANRTRQSGDAAGAIALYRKLESRFPQSNESVVAHVSLARLLLDHDARGALVELDVYLASGATDLREEALALRARAFGTLGRGAEEKRAWQALLAEHPDSLQAARAKERIEALP